MLVLSAGRPRDGARLPDLRDARFGGHRSLYAVSIFLASSFSNACNRLIASRISPRALTASSRERVLIPPELTLSSCAFVRACEAHFKMLSATCFSSVAQGLAQPTLLVMVLMIQCNQ